jgi:Txe/YoeB family toxin of Txe-Axe toxin-antitoxin module
VDNSRIPDLERLHKTFNNPDKPHNVRVTAYEAYKNILRQYKDRKLAEMRHRLIEAIKADDHEWIDKYEQQIIEYSHRMGYKV